MVKTLFSENALKSSGIIKRLVRDHVAQYKSNILTAVIFMIIAALCSAIIVRLTKPIIDRVLIEHDHRMLVLITSCIALLYLVKGFSEFFQNYLIKFIGQQILTDLQLAMYNHLLYADYSFIQGNSSGKIISRFTNDIILMRGAVSNLLVGCAKHFLSIVFLVCIMFTLDFYLSIFVFVAFPLAIYPIQKLGRKMRVVSHEAQEELSNFTSTLDESFSSISIIKSFCMEKYEFSKAKQITNKILDFYKKAAQLDSVTSPLMEILSGMTIIGLIWYGNYAITNGSMTTGTLFTFIMAFVSAYRPFKSLVSLNVNLQEGLAAAARVFVILDIKPSIADLPNAPNVEFNVPRISYENVTLKFPNNRTALENYNLILEPGKTYAFVGSSGSGKTTLANLMIRFFDPQSGKILIGGYDIKEISLNSLRKQIAFVSQETMLFDTTVNNNIVCGEKSASQEKIIEAAKAADAHEFISSLPQGYRTALGAKGKSLSGGQKQRISIARALYKNAPILLLDEATSALDPISEKKIILSLHKLRKNKTNLIITHRLNSITNVDKIIVMKNSQLVEQGSHEELLALKGEYYKLYNKELQENDKHV
ncbi:MAG TPA: ABC transporter ATP-binding protein [Candidatus Megaira endosymbiont of Nemacystus decipiens]|nr:ABC transporter ATP-binding protein [Candidatus Megaera endosymbiont of Nemacystus decipiens]